MNYLHYELDAGPDDVVEVTLDHAANVQLLDETNYLNYRDGRPYTYRGGYVKTSPYRIRPSYQGHWHLVIDLGGYAGTVRASAKVLPVSLQEVA
ncbi:MAG: DUF1883 domain-containing protein [Armatimonadota bacterium]|nr:DUF1883 domain-containing protein [Armatimonadota bacterium]